MTNATTRLCLALCVITLGALTGCGKAAPVAPRGIDSVFVQQPADNAGQEMARQEQEQRDAESDASPTGQVPGTGNERPAKH